MENNKKILIVEDEEALMESMATGLSENGFTVLKAYNGAEGLKTALEEHPDLILLDIMMPVMTGTEMLKKLREDQWGNSAQVMLLTNIEDMDNIAESIGEGVHDYLLKSNWSVKKIVDRINEKLSEGGPVTKDQI